MVFKNNKLGNLLNKSSKVLDVFSKATKKLELVNEEIRAMSEGISDKVNKMKQEQGLLEYTYSSNKKNIDNLNKFLTF